MPGAKYELQRKCEMCGNVFLARSIESKYCSRQCINRAYRLRKKESERQKQLDELAEMGIENDQDLISVPEAEAIFCVNRKTLYRLIKSKKIFSVNISDRMTRVRRSELTELLPLREKPIDRNVALPKVYNLEPEHCYTIGEITEKFKISEKTVYDAIRKYGIPMRQLGKFVYVPKSEVNTLFKKGGMV